MFDMHTLQRAIEERDARALAALYTEDATVIVMDRDHPPGTPRTIAGRDAIAAWYADICSRDMTHRIVAGLSDDAHVAFTESCAYPDGTKVFCSAMADLAEGRIRRQTNVQVWDS